jgi:tetratricopeptide (TPR) repeat protein
MAMNDGEQWIARGDRAGDAGALEEACDCYCRATQLAPLDVEAWTSLGHAQFELEDDDGAALSFRKALAVEPLDADLSTYVRHAVARSIAGCVARRRGVAGCVTDTVASVDVALDAALHDADLWSRKGCALWRAAAQRDASAPEALLLAASQSHAMALVASAAYLADAIAVSVDDVQRQADIWNARGEALMMQLRRFEDALVSFDRALALVPEHAHAEATENRACVLRDLLFEREALGAAAAAASAADRAPRHPSPFDLAAAAPYRTLVLPPTATQPSANPLHAAYCLRWLDRATCEWVVRTAEAHAARPGGPGGWALPSRGAGNALSIPEVAVAAVPALRAWLAPLLQFALRPALARLFSVPAEHLLFREVLVVRYDAAAERTSGGGGAGGAGATRDLRSNIPLHRDGNLIAWNVALNASSAAVERGGGGSGSGARGFSGGGTVIASLGNTAVQLERAGDVLVHPGSMLHASAPVTEGTRYILVGFVEAKMELGAECAMRRINEREEARGEMGCSRDREHLARYWDAVTCEPTESKT